MSINIIKYCPLDDFENTTVFEIRKAPVHVKNIRFVDTERAG